MFDPSDHRQIAQSQDLFHFQDEAPGMAFWHPRGLALYRALERAARRELERSGYEEVKTPELMRQPVWESSGHWQHFSEGMFKLEEDDGRGLALRPVNCPGHAQLFLQGVRSYRDLPLRWAEFGVVHRREPSGALAGLFRLREFTQDDGHIFCRPEQLADELLAFCQALQAFYRDFGFDRLKVGLSTRPPERFGDDAHWEEAEQALADAAQRAGLSVELQPGEGAFYGPKLEFKLEDRQGRIWQCGTIQSDFVMPERFQLEYVDAGGERRRPVMLHRALYGSVERFLGVLLEHHAGKLPVWLAPEQARVLPVNAAEQAYAEALLAALKAAGVRASLADASERLGSRVSAAREAAVPFVLVVGPREAAAREVSVSADGKSERRAFHAAVAELRAAAAPPRSSA
jgi:threonyl-tRNA synthetase